MFTPKRYLRLEWENVNRTLQETLRYRYSKKNVTEQFYQECGVRLDDLHKLVNRVQDNDQPGLFELWRQLARLSRLITNIERSHLEEFSWPFAEALKDVTRSAFSNVLFLFRAEGGLCSYALHPESPGIGRKRIYPVVFPRGIRDFVLLHTIIGHEFGHAALVSHGAALRNILTTLISDSIVAKPNDLFQWCEAHMGITQRGDDKSLSIQAVGWAKEFFCDLFGLLIMGPAFLPAFQTLLETPSFDPDPLPYVPSHPPFAPRAVALLYGARALGSLYSEQNSPNNLANLSTQLDKAFVEVASKWANGPLSILAKARIEEAALALGKFARNYASLLFPVPNPGLISQLMQAIRDEVPPVGPYPAAIASRPYFFRPQGQPSLIECDVIDFRHVLLAGWLRWSDVMESNNEEHFRQINSLCSHAIMQQEGISHWKMHAARAEAGAP